MTATDFNKDEKWYLAEATRMLNEATKLIKAKEKGATKKATAKKATAKKTTTKA